MPTAQCSTVSYAAGRAKPGGQLVCKYSHTRKNSLFAGSEGGAESWAILGSLVTTAKLNDLDPQTYLTDVLERIVSGRTKSHQLHDLLTGRPHVSGPNGLPHELASPHAVSIHGEGGYAAR